MEMSVDKQKELVTVKGTMDAKALTENLKEKLRRPVEIVPPKKDKEKEKQEKESNDNGGGGGGKKKKGGDAGGNGGQEAEGGKMEGNKMEYVGMIPGAGYGFGYQYPMPPMMPMHGVYEYGYPVGGPPMHAPQIFSDENPNACSVMWWDNSNIIKDRRGGFVIIILLLYY